MKESQIHEAFMVWLKKNRLFYIHSTFGKKATMTKDAPDFIILHCNRALLVECKTEKGALTAGQKASFAKIQAESGMVVHIARSVEQAVSAVETWLGVAHASGSAETVNTPSVAVVSGERAGGAFILTFAGKDTVFTGDPSPGGQVARVRTATPADLINLPRR